MSPQPMGPHTDATCPAYLPALSCSCVSLALVFSPNDATIAPWSTSDTKSFNASAWRNRRHTRR